MITFDQLCVLTSAQIALEWTDFLNKAMQAHRITTSLREQSFLSTCLYESGGLKTLVENLNYDAAGILRICLACQRSHLYLHIRYIDY